MLRHLANWPGEDIGRSTKNRTPASAFHRHIFLETPKFSQSKPSAWHCHVDSRFIMLLVLTNYLVVYLYLPMRTQGLYCVDGREKRKRCEVDRLLCHCPLYFGRHRVSQNCQFYTFHTCSLSHTLVFAPVYFTFICLFISGLTTTLLI